MTTSNDFSFTLPAILGTQGNRPYFLINVPMRMLKRIVAFDAGEVSERAQRDVNLTRGKRVSAYIDERTQNDEFFVIPTLTGNVDKADFEPCGEQGLGLVTIPMDAEVRLFDGQHRMRGIFDAEHKDSSFIAVQLFKGLSLRERQQGFADVNMTSSKPSAAISTAYNHKDPVSCLAMKLASIPLFKSGVDLERNVVSKDSFYWVSLKTVKDATKTAFSLKKQIDDGVFESAGIIWNAWGKVLNWTGIGLTIMASDYRQKYISSHGVYINALALVTAELLKYESVEDVAARILGFQDHPLPLMQGTSFHRRCVCPDTSRMLTDGRAKTLTASKIMQEMGVAIPKQWEDTEKSINPEYDADKFVSAEKEALERQAAIEKAAIEEHENKVLAKAKELAGFKVMTSQAYSSDLTPDMLLEALTKLNAVINEYIEEGTLEKSKASTFRCKAIRKAGDLEHSCLVFLNIRSLRAFIRELLGV